MVAKELPKLRLIPPGVKEDRDWRPQWLVYYSFSNLNYETLLIAAMSAMQYGWALERLIRTNTIANPELGPVHVLKADISDGFYCIGLLPTNTPKRGLVFPLEGEDAKLV